ncbi:MAG TPA: indole-3-glycerol phosphate synthase TrpC [Terriglobales bacterium]
MSEFLQKVMDEKRKEMRGVSATQRTGMARKAQAVRHRGGRLIESLSRGGIRIIAEFKRSSPSAGPIQAAADPAQVARMYEAAGAAGMSVLTEPNYFGGSLADLATARISTKLPLLRKDFVVDAFQLHEAVIAGADAALVIVAGLTDAELVELLRECAELKLDALVEVHTAEELERAAGAGARLIGVNNRNLKTLEVSLETSLKLAEIAPEDALLVSESGIRTADDIRMLRNAGYKGFLMGETLMRAEDPKAVLAELIAASTSEANA